MRAARERWAGRQSDLSPERLIFIVESGLSTKMARLRGWAAKGERCRAAIPHGHWKTITFVGGLTLTGFVAPMLLDGPMNGECFLALRIADFTGVEIRTGLEHRGRAAGGSVEGRRPAFSAF